jgi:ribonucleoside-diphosphate reductase beta chain
MGSEDFSFKRLGQLPLLNPRRTKPGHGIILEIQYAQDCLPRGILGLTAPMFREYVQYIADRRLERIGLKPIYKSKNPFPWMSETIDLQKEKNFFETRVTEYQSSGSLSWN